MKVMGRDWEGLSQGEKKAYPILGKRKASETLGPMEILQPI